METNKNKLFIELDNSISYKSNSKTFWKIELHNIKIIGEYTNQDGPCADDWFYIFVTANGDYYEASVYDDENCSFITQLGEKLNAKIFPTLASSADFNSNIMWPEELKNKNGIDFIPIKSIGLLGKIIDVIAGSVELKLSKICIDFLKIKI